MNRREWLKILAGGAAGAAATSWAGRSRPSVVHTAPMSSYFAVTDRPREAIDRLLAVIHTASEPVRTGVRRIAPIPQDLTLICGGAVLDPSNRSSTDDVFRFATELRKRQSPATHLVSIEPAVRKRPDRIIIETNGVVVESIERSKEYKRIVVPGIHGDTVLKWMDGELSVVSSACRNELCKRCGSIRSGRIICAPNRLVATVGDPFAAVDAITG